MYEYYITYILGHNWLTHHNLLIDWVSGSITFWTSKQVDLTQPPTAETCTTMAMPKTTPEPPPKSKAPPVALINAATFKWACKMDSAVTFQLNIALSNVKGHAAKLDPDPSNMENVPEAYQDCWGTYAYMHICTKSIQIYFGIFFDFIFVLLSFHCSHTIPIFSKFLPIFLAILFTSKACHFDTALLILLPFKRPRSHG